MSIFSSIRNLLKLNRKNKISRLIVYFQHLLEYKKIAEQGVLNKSVLLRDKNFVEKKNNLRRLRYKLELQNKMNIISQNLSHTTQEENYTQKKATK